MSQDSVLIVLVLVALGVVCDGAVQGAGAAREGTVWEGADEVRLFTGIFINYTTSSLAGLCRVANTFTESCTCPEGSTTGAPLPYNDPNLWSYNYSYCYDTAAKARYDKAPKTTAIDFGGGYEVITESNACYVPNAFTGSCGCPSSDVQTFVPYAMKAFAARGTGLHHANVTMVLCFPTKRLRGSVLTGLWTEVFAGLNPGRCEPGPFTANCSCPTNGDSNMEYNTYSSDGQNMHMLCFTSCRAQTTESQCSRVPYCGWCPLAGRGRGGNCYHRTPSQDYCCANDVGSTVCSSEERCCAVKGHQPTCCSSTAPVCSNSTGQCSCPARNGCTAMHGKNYGFGCCLGGASCCMADFNAMCCTEGTTCCSDLQSIVACCPSGTVCDLRWGGYCKPTNGSTAAVPSLRP